jgi:hypothetical protein
MRYLDLEAVIWADQKAERVVSSRAKRLSQRTAPGSRRIGQGLIGLPDGTKAIVFAKRAEIAWAQVSA